MRRSMNAWRWLTRTSHRDSFTDSPSHARRLLGLALLCSAVGFYRLVYFIKLGYALSIGALATFTVASAHRVLGPPALVQNLLLGPGRCASGHIWCGASSSPATAPEQRNRCRHLGRRGVAPTSRPAPAGVGYCFARSAS
jgi:hypothetical protein